MILVKVLKNYCNPLATSSNPNPPAVATYAAP
jgi:hypothetical protein